MRSKLFIVTAPISLLAACGGSTTDEESSPTPEPSAPMAEAGAGAPGEAVTQAPPTGETTPAATESALPTAAPTATATATPPSPAAAARTEAAVQSAPPAAFSQCRACHSVEPGRNGVGPTLFGIVGSKAGEVPGYSFSPALKNSGITWDRASLDKWLQGPVKMVPGTKMVIALPDAQKRKAVIDYLETLK